MISNDSVCPPSLLGSRAEEKTVKLIHYLGVEVLA
jgi:hypothetical protein